MKATALSSDDGEELHTTIGQLVVNAGLPFLDILSMSPK